jgi:RimJ/RimL family protein N-acetyltransferase
VAVSEVHVHEDFRRIAPPLEGKLVRLRTVEEGDVAAINAGIWNPNVSRTLSGPGWPEPVAGTRDFLDRVRTSDSAVLFVIETLAGELIGAISLDLDHGANRSAMLGIWIAEPHWDQGYGTDAVRVMCRFGFREMNLQRVGLFVHENNPRGRRSYEKVGFVEEGRLRRFHFMDGRYHDTTVMGLLSEEFIEG